MKIQNEVAEKQKHEFTAYIKSACTFKMTSLFKTQMNICLSFIYTVFSVFECTYLLQMTSNGMAFRFRTDAGNNLDLIHRLKHSSSHAFKSLKASF